MSKFCMVIPCVDKLPPIDILRLDEPFQNITCCVDVTNSPCSPQKISSRD